MKEKFFLAIDKIKNKENREILSMRLEKRLSVNEVAEILGCSKNAVKIRAFKGLEELKIS